MKRPRYFTMLRRMLRSRSPFIFYDSRRVRAEDLRDIRPGRIVILAALCVVAILVLTSHSRPSPQPPVLSVTYTFKHRAAIQAWEQQSRRENPTKPRK